MNSTHRARPAKMTGYTIVELMFVLAIAGVILLIVLEAIPALGRSGRNNQRRQDVNTILRAVSQYELSNSGNFPQDCGNGPNKCNQADPDPSYPNDYFLKNVQKHLTIYDPQDIALTPQDISTRTDRPPVTSPNRVKIYNYEKCKPHAVTVGKATIDGAGYSDVVALFALEKANGGYISQCLQL